MNSDQPGKNGPVVFWGTYDLGKPRVRLLIKAGKRLFQQVEECHESVWDGIEDKSQVKGILPKARLAAKWLFAYPRLILRYLRLPSHELVIIPYMGQLDILILYPFAKLRGATICWDIFLSLYDTIVIDRRLARRGGLASGLLYAWEWLATRLADILIIDTKEHARYIETLFRLPHKQVSSLWTGVETDSFAHARTTLISNKNPGDKIRVLYYGQFIPLHGLDTIIAAADLIERERNVVCEWILIGKGQLQDEIDKEIDNLQLQSILRIDWVDYSELADWISKADLCLGIFGSSGKAMRVVPNKIYQILAAGRPLVTADSPAIREVFSESTWIKLVKPGDPQELKDGVIEIANQLYACDSPIALDCLPVIGEETLANQLEDILKDKPGRFRG